MTSGIKEPGPKLRRVPTALCRLLCLSKARRRPVEEEDHWELREERRRRRRRIPFDNLTKSMLRCLENCNEVKVDITDLQARVEVLAQICISIQQVARPAINGDGQHFFEVFWQEEGKIFVVGWARWEAQRKGLVDLERRCQDISREIQNAEQKTRFFQSAIEGKLRVQDRASK